MKLQQLLVATAAALTVSSMAHATVMVAHIRGLGEGYLQFEQFSDRRTFTDAPFSATFVYDTDLGIDTSGPGHIGRDGGVFFGGGVDDPVYTADLKIKGLDFAASSLEFRDFWSKGYPAGPLELDVERDDNVDATLNFSLSADGLTSDPAQAFTSTAGGGGFFAWSTTFAPETVWGALIGLTVTRFDVEPLSASTGDYTVPEPATWLEMLLGFAGMGGLARYRHSPRSGPARARWVALEGL